MIVGDESRAVSGDYGPRYGPFFTFAPQPAPYGRSSSCTHVAPDSCALCDGTRLRASARIPETLPPGPSEVRARRSHYERWAAEWRARLGITPTPAEEAS